MITKRRLSQRHDLTRHITRPLTHAYTLFVLIVHGPADLSAQQAVQTYPARDTVALVEQPPDRVTVTDSSVTLVDFAKVAFGNLQLRPPADAAGSVTVHFGEKLSEGRVDRKPPGSVRYSAVTVELRGDRKILVAPPADPRNTEQISKRHPPAVLTPEEWGVVVPFRWVEIEGWKGEMRPEHVVRRAAFSKSWNDDAADFKSSDETLNRIWELCRYSIKATTFAGVYIDGDRERIPYEADSYLNQLSHYATDDDIRMARDTFTRLMHYGTWPTECAFHMVFIAHADWMHTGDRDWLASNYDGLKTKLHTDRVGDDGLIHSTPAQRGKDLVDWPPSERDGFVFTEVNTVVNAFHLAAIDRMAELAQAIGKVDEAAEYRSRHAVAIARFNELLLDEKTGLYRDGPDSDHASLHANLFPLAFDLTPASHKESAVNRIRDRGMACSVYAAQFLLEALFQNGADELAVALITAENERSWRHMLNSGTTITWEAWDHTVKGNQDWNHPWGAAPANLLPRFVLGVRPTSPGWRNATIRPMTGGLTHARGKVPTPKGPIFVDWKITDVHFKMDVSVPPGMIAAIDIPAPSTSRRVAVNGTEVGAKRVGDRWVLDAPITETSSIETQ